jgi:hypothetical protein
LEAYLLGQDLHSLGHAALDAGLGCTYRIGFVLENENLEIEKVRECRY